MRVTGSSRISDEDDLPAKPILNDYAERFPELGPLDELPSELIGLEYEVRCLGGEKPNFQEYQDRFSQHGDLEGLLSKVDLVVRGKEKTLAADDGSDPVGVTVPSENHPTTLGRYELNQLLGRGGMGAVYKARHALLNCDVAVKLLSPELTQNDQAVARFEREIAAVGGLQHANLVRAMDADEIDGQLVLVMEYLDGVDLARLMDRLGPLPCCDACELTRQAALGLASAQRTRVDPS